MLNYEEGNWRPRMSPLVMGATMTCKEACDYIRQSLKDMGDPSAPNYSCADIQYIICKSGAKCNLWVGNEVHRVALCGSGTCPTDPADPGCASTSPPGPDDNTMLYLIGAGAVLALLIAFTMRPKTQMRTIARIG